MIHSYPWYPQDWRGSETRIRLTLAGRSIYRDLLDYCWEEGSLPADHRTLGGIAGATPQEFKREWPSIADKFEERDGRLFNRRVDERRPELVRWHEQKRNAGVKSGEARRERKFNGRSNGNGVLFEPSASSSVVVNPLPPLKGGAALPPEREISKSDPAKPKRGTPAKPKQAWFEQWWPQVWRQVSRGAAEKAFGAMVRDQETFAAVMAATQLQTPLLRKRSVQYQPYPSKWLNDKRWLDDLSVGTEHHSAADSWEEPD